MPLGKREKTVSILLGLALTVSAVWLQRTPEAPAATVLERLEALAYDLRFRLFLPAPETADERIIIVDIDDRSLAAEGQWPWPRERMALLVDRLHTAGTSVIAFDIVFAEPQENPVRRVTEALSGRTVAAPVRETLDALAPRFDGDRRFAQALADGDSVLGYVLHDRPDPPAGLLPPPLQKAPVPAGDDLVLARRSSYTANLPQLQRHAKHGGFFTSTPDRDGVIRRIPLVLRHGDGIYPSLALETVRLYLLLDGVELELAGTGGVVGLEAVRIGRTRIPTDERGAVLVPYRGGRGSFHYVSATDVLSGTAAAGRLDQAIALVGSTAAGLHEFRTTPLGGILPGVEIHANLIAGLLDGQLPQEPKWAEGAGHLILLATGLLLSTVLPLLSPFWLVAVATTAAAAILLGNLALWAAYGLALPLAAPLLLVLALGGGNAVRGFAFEDRRRRLLQRRFGEYVPRELVEEMARHPHRYRLDGESREMTVLFADIRGFTTVAEALDADELRRLLNRFFTPMTRIVFEHRGTIDKYVGDMLMAFWGAPIRDPEHRRHAVAAAQAMLEEMAQLRRAFRAEGLPDLRIGIGINSGLMSVGDMGSAFRRAYTVIGDSVNLASRLEGLTERYGVPLLVGEDTCRGLDAETAFRELDRVRVKGRQRPVSVHEPVGPGHSLSPAERRRLARYHRALAAYRLRRWQEAEAAFAALASEEPERRVHQLYLERVRRCAARDPGPGWDATEELDEKRPGGR